MPRAHRTLTAPHRRATPATAAAALAAVLMVAVPVSACSSSSKPASSTTTSPAPASSTPTSATAPQQHQEAIWRQQIETNVQQWGEALYASLADPTHPQDLSKYAVDPLLSGMEGRINEFRTHHWVSRPAPQSKARTWVLNIRFGRDGNTETATVQTCEIDDHWLVDTRTNTPINTAVGIYKETTSMVLDGGVWKEKTGVGTKVEGVSACRAEH